MTGALAGLRRCRARAQGSGAYLVLGQLSFQLLHLCWHIIVYGAHYRYEAGRIRQVNGKRVPRHGRRARCNSSSEGICTLWALIGALIADLLLVLVVMGLSVLQLVLQHVDCRLVVELHARPPENHGCAECFVVTLSWERERVGMVGWGTNECAIQRATPPQRSKQRLDMVFTRSEPRGTGWTTERDAVGEFV